MSSAKRERHRARRAAGRPAPPPPATAPPQPAKRTAGPCERCGAGCRTEKPLYGWVCTKCCKELDAYYQVKIGLSGDNIVSAYHEDVRQGMVPRPGFPDAALRGNESGTSPPRWPMPAPLAPASRPSASVFT